MELMNRKEVPDQLTWDLSALYASEEDMYADAARAQRLCQKLEGKYRGHLDSPEQINACLDGLRELQACVGADGP